MKRRDFLKAGLATGGAFILGINFAGCGGGDAARMRDTLEASGGFQPNAFITVTPDNRVLVAVGKTEMGQGVFTSHSMLVAEELEVELDRVEPYHETGPAFEMFGVQQTGGSSSVRETYLPMRKAAAAAREMFISAAAATWNCPRSECSAENAHIVHASGKKLSYGELTEAAAKQEIVDDPPLKKRSEFKLIGKNKRRVDIVPKINGEAVYGLDVDIEGMVKAVVVRPPVLHSTVESFDADEAREMTGIVDIFEFERGVAVIAEKYWQARRAADKVDVRWNLGVLSEFDSKDLSEAAIEHIQKTPGVTIRDDGDVEDALENEEYQVIESVYEAPFLAHAPLEPMNGTAWVEDDRCTIWAPVQWQSAARGDVAGLLGIDREKVVVNTTYLGGGFGRRLMIDYIIEAVLLSKRVGRPVQVVWSREDDTRGGYYRPYNLTQMKGAIDSRGKVRAFSYHNMSQSLLNLRDWLPAILPQWMPRVTRLMLARTAGNAVDSDTLPDILATEGANDATYEIDNFKVEHTQIHLDVPVTFWRSVGHSNNGFVMEGFVDELAEAAGRDAYEFRREMLSNDARKLGVLDAVARLASWGESEPEDGFGRGIAVHKSFGTYCAQVIEAGVVDGEIRARKVWCAVDCGVVVNPDIVKSQMESCIMQGLSAAIHQKIEFVEGRVVQGNFDTFKFLRMYEMPEVEVVIIDSNADPTGVGEPGLPPVAPALAAALYDVTGKRLRSMPFADALREA